MSYGDIIRIGELISKKIVKKEKLTEQEEQALSHWLESSEKNREYYHNYSIEKGYREFGEITALSSREKQWRRLKDKLDNYNPARRRFRWIGYAAAITLIVSVSTTLLWQSDHHENPQLILSENSIIEEPPTNRAVLILADGSSVDLSADGRVIEDRGQRITVSDGLVQYESLNTAPVAETIYNTIKVPRKGIYSMRMSDGTRVFLNPGSELRYPVNFGNGPREVTLHGEAQFDVKYDPDRPFVVTAGQNRITVLGTTFIISAYDDEPFNSTSLLSGSVEVANEANSVKRILTPGKQAVWKTGGNGIAVEEFNVDHLNQYREGVVIFEEKDIRSILRMLSRWFDVDFDYRGDATVNHSISVKFSRTDDLQTTLDRITKVGGPEFIVGDSVVYVN